MNYSGKIFKICLIAILLFIRNSSELSVLTQVFTLAGVFTFICLSLQFILLIRQFVIFKFQSLCGLLTFESNLNNTAMKSITTGILLFLWVVPQLVLAQKATPISGVVVDSKGQPVIGANIFIKGSYDGASTGTDGRYSFATETTNEQFIVVTLLGYEQQEQRVVLEGKSIRIDLTLKEKLSQLNAVTITAGAFEAGDEKRSNVLSSLDIATTAGATADIFAAINTLPGAQRVGEEGKLFVRGGDSYETKTFIDGLLVQKPYNSSVPDLPARGRFSPFMFSGITFSSGGYSAEYGQALSSALLLRTNGLATETETGISIMSVGLGASHTQRWDNTSLSISGDYTNLTPYVGLVKQNISWKQAPESKGGAIVLRHKISEAGILKVYSNYSGSSLSLSRPTPEATENNISLHNSNSYHNATYQGSLSQKWMLYAGMGYTYNADNIEIDEQKVEEKDQSVQGKVTLEHQLAESLWIKFGSELIMRSYNQHYQASPADAAIETTFNDQLLAAFIEADWYLSNKLVARAGIRAELSTLLAQTNVAPRLSLAYKVTENGQFSAAYGKFFQQPEAQFLRITDALDAENASHYILNYQYQKNNRTFRVEGYYKHYSDLVKYDPEKLFEPGSYLNSGTGFARGVDFFWRDRKSIKNADYWISYSLLDTRRNYRDYSELAAPTFASKHNLAVVYKHFVPAMQTQLGATYSFASGRPYHNPNQPGFNQGRTSAYHDLSFNASYQTNLWGNFTVLYVSATNLLGTEQVFGYRYTSTPNEAGTLNRMSVEPPAKRVLFAGLFINFGGTGIHH